MYVIKCKDQYLKFVIREVFPEMVDNIDDATKYETITPDMHFIVDVMKDKEKHNDIKIEMIWNSDFMYS